MVKLIHILVKVAGSQNGMRVGLIIIKALKITSKVDRQLNRWQVKRDENGRQVN